jgi:hypothetical protein
MPGRARLNNQTVKDERQAIRMYSVKPPDNGRPRRRLSTRLNPLYSWEFV